MWLLEAVNQVEQPSRSNHFGSLFSLKPGGEIFQLSKPLKFLPTDIQLPYINKSAPFLASL